MVRTLRDRSPFARSGLMALLLGLLISPVGVADAASVPVSSKPLTTYYTCVLTANPATSTTAIDSYVDQAAATTNFGTATTLSVQSRSGARNRRAFIDFDLTRCSPSIPSSVTITNGTLRLYVTAIPAACQTYDAYLVTGSQWTESGLTWTNAPATAATATSSASIGASPCGYIAANQYVTWDVTADTQLFASGASNFGWMIRNRVEGNTTQRTATFSAKNLGTLAQSPQLIVTYRR